MNWHAWELFQSKDARKIRKHLTPEEERDLISLVTKSGTSIFSRYTIPGLVFIAAAASAANAAGANRRDMFAISIATSLLVAAITFWLSRRDRRNMRTRMRLFLCSTHWAQAQGLKPDKLPLTWLEQICHSNGFQS